MILALGGNGFIGYNFVKRFAQKESIRVFGRSRKNNIVSNNVEFIDGDFEHIDFGSLLENVDTVFHFISSIVPFDGTDKVMYDIKSNILPTVELLENMKKRNIKKIFFISSGGSIYGECEIPAKENSRLSPSCVYAVQKVVIESYLQLYEKYDDIKGYILRIANPYGLEINKKTGQGIIPIFTEKILKGETIEIWGTGDNKRDYIHIDEVVDAIEAVYQYNGIHRIFNIGTGSSYSIKEIIKLIELETKKHTKIEYKEERKCDINNSSLDVSLIYHECGWKSKLTIEQGIKDYVKRFLLTVI